MKTSIVEHFLNVCKENGGSPHRKWDKSYDKLIGGTCLMGVLGGWVELSELSGWEHPRALPYYRLSYLKQEDGLDSPENEPESIDSFFKRIIGKRGIRLNIK